MSHGYLRARTEVCMIAAAMVQYVLYTTRLAVYRLMLTHEALLVGPKWRPLFDGGHR